MPWPDLQGLGDLPLPIPPGALFLFHPSVTEFQPPWPFCSSNESSSLLSQGLPSSFIFTSYTLLLFTYQFLLIIQVAA